MKSFRCQHRGRLVFFENVRCLRCGQVLGCAPDARVMSAIEPLGDGSLRPLASELRARSCSPVREPTCALNSIAHSVGQPGADSFALPPPMVEKLLSWKGSWPARRPGEVHPRRPAEGREPRETRPGVGPGCTPLGHAAALHLF